MTDIQLDGAKMLACGTAVKAQHAKHNMYHTYQVFDTYALESSNEQVNCDVFDSIPDDSELDAYFSSIDIEQCNVSTL